MRYPRHNEDLLCIEVFSRDEEKFKYTYYDFNSERDLWDILENFDSFVDMQEFRFNKDLTQKSYRQYYIAGENIDSLFKHNPSFIRVCTI